MTFVYGIIGLGVIVFIHELGHFIAARIVGVKVETFSIGMGPVLLHKTIKGTDYRLSLIPIGGYCGMKGEKSFQEAIETGASEIQGEPDSFYGIKPLKRAFIAFCGPFSNVIFAVISFAIIAMMGYTYYTTGNKVIISTEVYPESVSSAEEAGIKTGDRIISINNLETKYFSDISEYISTHPNETVLIKVERDESLLEIPVQVMLDKNTGAGKIGIVNWVDPVISYIEPNSAAYKAGLEVGDYITKINGIDVLNTSSIQKILTNNTEIELSGIRNNEEFTTTLLIPEDNIIGISFKVIEVIKDKYSFFPAIIKGITETGEMIALTFKSIGLLFQGVDVTKAVSGPIRITRMLGETAQAGFSASFSIGVISVLQFLSLISISLFIMNLLPIPILDGGIILFAFIETIIRKKLHPKFLYYIQFVGIAFIILIFAIALFGDLRYLFTSK